MMEDYSKNGIRVEWNEERVQATLAFSSTINIALSAWSTQQILRTKPQAARLALQLLSKADELDKLGDVTGAAKNRAAARQASQRAGSAFGRVLGKIFWVDTVIWAGTGAIDLGLNFLGIPEEDQGIFADFYGGWSPIAALIGLGFSAGAEAAGMTEEELMLELVERVVGEETAEAVIWAAMAFYIERINLDLEIDSYTMSRSINEGIHEAWIDSVFVNPDPDMLLKFCEDVIVFTAILCILRYGWRQLGRIWATMVDVQ